MWESVGVEVVSSFPEYRDSRFTKIEDPEYSPQRVGSPYKRIPRRYRKYRKPAYRLGSISANQSIAVVSDCSSVWPACHIDMMGLGAGQLAKCRAEGGKQGTLNPKP